MPKKRAGRIAYTVVFYPDKNKIPGVTNQEASTNTGLDLIEATYDPAPTAPFISI